MTLVLATVATLTANGLVVAGPLPQQVQRGLATEVRDTQAAPLDDDEKRREAYYEAVQTASTTVLQRMAQAELLVEIDELKSMFDLPEATVKRLQLAARGAAKRTLDQARDSNQATMRRTLERRLTMNNIDLTRVEINGQEIEVEMPDGLEQPKDDDGPKLDQLRIILARRGSSTHFTVRYQNGSSSTSLGPRGNELRTNAVWAKSYSELLTADQRREYTAHCRKRDKEVITNLLLTTLQHELRLSEKQGPQVRKVIAQSITVTSTTFRSGPEYVVQQFRPKLKAKNFAGVLTKSQLDLFTAAQAYYRRFER